MTINWLDHKMDSLKNEEIETINKSVINVNKFTINWYLINIWLNFIHKNVIKNEEQMTRSCSAIITPGEASESDEEEEEDNQNEDHLVKSEELVSEKQTNDSMSNEY